MGLTPIPKVPSRPPTPMERFERELRRGHGSAHQTEWLNMIGVLLMLALVVAAAALVWILVAS